MAILADMRDVRLWERYLQTLTLLGISRPSIEKLDVGILGPTIQTDNSVEMTFIIYSVGRVQEDRP